MGCVFCKVVRKELGPVLHETSLFVVVMDIQPLSRGHLLVIPKHHGETLEDIPDEYLAGALVLIKKIVGRLGTVTSYNVLQNNRHIQSVPHVHFHVIPYHESEGEGLKIAWNPAGISQEEISIIGESYKNLMRGL